jgi:hypothetical protein
MRSEKGKLGCQCFVNNRALKYIAVYDHGQIAEFGYIYKDQSIFIMNLHQ